MASWPRRATLMPWPIIWFDSAPTRRFAPRWAVAVGGVPSSNSRNLRWPKDMPRCSTTRWRADDARVCCRHECDTAADIRRRLGPASVKLPAPGPPPATAAPDPLGQHHRYADAEVQPGDAAARTRKTETVVRSRPQALGRVPARGLARRQPTDVAVAHAAPGPPDQSGAADQAACSLGAVASRATDRCNDVAGRR